MLGMSVVASGEEKVELALEAGAVENPGQASGSKCLGAILVECYPFVVVVACTAGYLGAIIADQQVGWPWMPADERSQ